jgi:molybdopterin converting factor small subunit
VTTVRIPPVLRVHTDGGRQVEVTGASVADALADLFARFPALGAALTEDGALSSFVNVYVNDRDVRYREGLDTAVESGDTIILLPAMAGGAHRAPRRRRLG